MLLSTATINLFAFIGNAVLVLYASRTLGLSPSLIGFVFGAGAIRGVIGAATFGRVERRLGLGRAVVFASFAFPLSMLLYPAARGSTLVAAVLLGAGEFLAAVAVLWLDISIGAVFAQEIPDQLRSRVAGAYGPSTMACDHLAPFSEDSWVPGLVYGTLCGYCARRPPAPFAHRRKSPARGARLLPRQTLCRRLSSHAVSKQ